MNYYGVIVSRYTDEKTLYGFLTLASYRWNVRRADRNTPFALRWR